MRFIVPIIAATLILLASVLPSCYPTYGLETTDYRTVLTIYDTSANFNELRTYYLVDSVFHILETGIKDDITRKYDDELLSKVASNFDTYGWTRITDTALMMPSIWVMTNGELIAVCPVPPPMTTASEVTAPKVSSAKITENT